MDRPRLDFQELTPDHWPDVAKWFGANGACGGCWCMFWRLPKGERYDDVKGKAAKRRFKALVTSRKDNGILAFQEGEAVGWCAFERRVDFPRLDRALEGRATAAFAYTGVTSMFEACGFAVAEARPRGKQRYRKVLQTARPRRRGDLRA